MNRKIYCDNAATSKLDPEAFEMMKPLLLADFGNASQPYSFGRKSKILLTNARKSIASSIGADEEEIFFTSGGSESDNWALKCFGSRDGTKRIVTSPIEHHAILNTCKALAGHIATEFLPVDEFGLVDPTRLDAILTRFALPESSNPCCLVSVMTANNEIGTIEPIKELANVAHNHGAYFHTDAVQAVGHIPLNVHNLNVDMLSSSSHKFNGPKGVGFLYIKKGTLIHSLINGGKQEFGFRAGTENVASIVGMAKALENNVRLLTSNQKKLQCLEKEFYEVLDSAKVDYRRNGATNHLPGMINISIKGVSGELLLHRMDLAGCYISTGSACDGESDQISHVIKAIKVPPEYAYGTIRISFGKYNEIGDGEETAKRLLHILETKL